MTTEKKLKLPSFPIPLKKDKKAIIERLAKSIILESSVLCTIPLSLKKSEFKELTTLSKLFKIPILIPEISFLEWCEHLCIDTLAEMNSYTESGTTLKCLYSDLNIIPTKSKDDIRNDVKNHLEKFIKDNEVLTIPLSDIPISRLIKMSVEKIKPFEEKKEKGFRDCINLFSVLDYARKEKGCYWFITNDRIYSDKDVMNIASNEYNVDLIIVKSIQDAVDSLREHISQLIKKNIEYYNLLLTIYLLTQKDNILKYIKEEVPIIEESSLNKDLKLGYYPKIMKIGEISIDNIYNASILNLRPPIKSGNYNITFIVKGIVPVTIKKDPPTIKRTFKFNQEVTESNTLPLQSILYMLSGDTLTIDDYIDIQINADITFNKEAAPDQPDKFFNLSLKKAIVL